MDANNSSNLYEILADIYLRFGSDAFLHRGFVPAMLRERQPDLEDEYNIIEFLDENGIIASFAAINKKDDEQQEQCVKDALQNLADKRMDIATMLPYLEAIGDSLRWKGESWREALQSGTASQADDTSPVQTCVEEAPVESFSQPTLPDFKFVETAANAQWESMGITIQPDNAASAPASTTVQPDYKIGDELQFGQYYHDSDTEMQPLTWVVWGDSYDDNQIILVTKEIIEARPYDVDRGQGDDISFAGSELFKWLNNDFLLTAFDAVERARIVEVTCSPSGCNYVNDAYDDGSLIPADDTPQFEAEPTAKARVILLTCNDIVDEKDLGNFDNPACIPLQAATVTPYAFSHGAYRDTENGCGIWRICGWGRTHRLSMTVDQNGYLDEFGDSVFADYVGIRPAVVYRITPPVFNDKN